MSLELLYKSAPFFVRFYENKGKILKTCKEIDTTTVAVYNWLKHFSQAKLIIKKKEGRQFRITFTKKGKIFYQKLKTILQILHESNQKV